MPSDYVHIALFMRDLAFYWVDIYWGYWVEGREEAVRDGIQLTVCG